MGVAFSNKSLINVFGDDITESQGSYTRNGSILSLGANSWIKYERVFDSNQDLISTDSALAKIIISCDDASVSSRYNSKIMVKFKVHYYETSVDSNGQNEYGLGSSDVFIITPYFDSETDGFVEDTQLNLRSSPISRLELYIYNTSELNISIGNLGIYNSLSITEATANTVTMDCTLTGLKSVADGMAIYFTNGTIGIQWLEDASGNLAGANVDKQRVITFSEDMNMTISNLLGW